MVKRLVLIRPGETDWNREHRWQGWVAAPLNAQGRRQVHKLASFVRNMGMSALYSSDLKRAEETANILAASLGFTPIFEARLRERKIGEWQGLTIDEMRAWYPDEYAHFIGDPANYPPPMGESRNEVKARVLAAVAEILAQDKGETVGILSHTTAIKALMSDLLPDYNQRDLDIDNTSVTTVMKTDGHWQVVAADDVSHLEGLDTNSVSELEY